MYHSNELFCISCVSLLQLTTRFCNCFKFPWKRCGTGVTVNCTCVFYNVSTQETSGTKTSFMAGFYYYHLCRVDGLFCKARTGMLLLWWFFFFFSLHSDSLFNHQCWLIFSLVCCPVFLFNSFYVQEGSPDLLLSVSSIYLYPQLL